MNLRVREAGGRGGTGGEAYAGITAYVGITAEADVDVEFLRHLGENKLPLW